MCVAIRIVITLFMLGALNAAADQVYRWTDEHGQLHFSDSPPPGTSANEESVEFIDNPDPDAAAAQLKAYQEAAVQRRIEAEQHQAAVQEATERDAERQGYCDNARDIVSRLSSRPAARYQREDGTYERYSNAELEQRIVEAREREQEYCY